MLADDGLPGEDSRDEAWFRASYSRARCQRRRRPEPGAQIIIVLRAVRVISRGVRGKVNFGIACVFPGCGGFRCRQVYGMEPVLAGGAE
jgi:hypothetical protein